LNENGLRPDVNSLDVLISLADLYIENGLMDEAKELLKTAIKENKEEIKPYSKLSKVYIDQGEEDEAVKILKSALEIRPESKEIRGLLKSLKIEEEKEVTKKKKEITKVELGGSLNEVLNFPLRI
jgi:tetratricopeptide (TPR) repeat protein